MAPVQPLNDTEAAQLKVFIKQIAGGVDGCLENWLPKPVGEHARLYECMRYSTFAGGKRLRPALLAAAYTVCGGNDVTRALWAGAGLEMIHTYSLIQDDLPCMDNDDLRRGKPTAHKQFDEVTALMASDALQTGAYELLSDVRVHPDAAVRLEVIRLFTRSSGGAGMVAGQMLDMQWEWKKPEVTTVEMLDTLSKLKTGMNLQAACEAGAVLAAQEGGMVRAAMRTYGESLGRAYQIFDDVLDVTGTTAELGKTAGKDEKSGKTTYVSLLGLEGAKARAHTEIAKACDALGVLGDQAENLKLLARYCVHRHN